MQASHTRSLNVVFALLALYFVSIPAHAVIPSTLNYQGHLTDSSGVPVEGAVNMTFKIYDVDVGGIALWSDSRSVTVNHGIFSIELGQTPSPFPVDLFEKPLWIGLSVEADAEMTPRRPVTSTGFTFKAGDANTLDGSSASSLDQSAHVTDTANPHNVTAAQVGAADAGTLSSHVGNLSNPHSVTAVQVGAASSVNFIEHEEDISAHHQRYSNGEAVVAMGTKNDANALNHDKYSNSNAVAAILAADGAGSTLDADKVDGLQASDIIDAAQDEVRTPISSLPYIINASGSYYLTGNLDGSSGSINISSDDVTLDLMGFTIDGGGTIGDYGIYIGTRSNVIVRNGTVKGFGFAGIYQYSTTANNARVVDVQALGNGTLGTGSAHSGIYVAGLNSRVAGCTAGGNGGYGIYAGDDSRLTDNIVYSNTGYYAMYGGINSSISYNTVYDNTGAYGIDSGGNSKLTDNIVYNNNDGIYAGSFTIITGNISKSNNGFGIGTDYSAIISGNVSNGNSGIGIYSNDGSTVTGNTVRSNGTAGIKVNNTATITGNTVDYNGSWGIYGFNSATIKDNTIHANNSSDNANEGGIYVRYNGLVSGNIVTSNKQNNIYVYNYGNTIENNLITSSGNGIFFSNFSSHNFYGNNRVYGNTTNFNLNGTTQTTNTYLPNISF